MVTTSVVDYAASGPNLHPIWLISWTRYLARGRAVQDIDAARPRDHWPPDDATGPAPDR